MTGRKPHHYCGILILLLAMLSIFAWTYYPPQKTEAFSTLVVESVKRSPVNNGPAPDRTPTPILATDDKEFERHK